MNRLSLFSVVFTLLLHTNSCVNNQTTELSEIYITPRFVRSSGWSEPGIFLFRLNRQSIKFPYKELNYNTKYVRDSMYGLFYTKVQIPTKLFSELIPLQNQEFGIKRIMIVHSTEDTLFIDNKYNVISNKGYFLPSKDLKKFLESLMPIEMRDNWIYDVDLRRTTQEKL